MFTASTNLISKRIRDHHHLVSYLECLHDARMSYVTLKLPLETGLFCILGSCTQRAGSKLVRRSILPSRVHAHFTEAANTVFLLGYTIYGSQ